MSTPSNTASPAPQLNAEITAKYDVSYKLQAAKTHFGKKYGDTLMDLRTALVALIDDFCQKYLDQPYFKLKTKATPKPS